MRAGTIEKSQFTGAIVEGWRHCQDHSIKKEKIVGEVGRKSPVFSLLLPLDLLPGLPTN